jgi:hypothetical protein
VLDQEQQLTCDMAIECAYSTHNSYIFNMGVVISLLV